MKEKLLAALKAVPNEYKSIPFWSWNNSLDEKELVRQIGEMKSADVGGFIMHARTGLKDEYLGEKWFSCVEACLKEARRLKMDAWVYDENGWPSGFVGGKLLENHEFRARFLEYKRGDFDKDAFCTYIPCDGGYERVSAPRDGVKEYENVYLRVSPANTDILNPEVVDAFINETHEKYYARFKDYFGKELVGFFTDEPQYYRWATPYTPCAEKSFKDRGEDIRDGLIWLFKSDERGYAFRQKYFAELNRLYVTNYYAKINGWCREHGCLLTGHSVEETTLRMQMWGGAEVMTSYAHEDIPCIDDLGRKPISELAPVQVASVASQLGKKFVLTETFACSGNDVTPYELKSIGDAQYFLGVNKMCQHLYPYSLARGGKTDHPPVFSPHGNWFDGFGVFNGYFNRLGYIVANTRASVDVAIVHPQRDIWLDYIREADETSVEETEADFDALIASLRKNGVTYHYLDETLLAEYGKCEDGGLKAGERFYDTILLPKTKTIAATTLELLKNFKGRLCVLSEPRYVDGVKADVTLKGNTTFAELCRSAKSGFTCEDGRSFVALRKGDIGEFVFVKNLSYDKESRVKFDGLAEKYKILDLATMTEKYAENEFTLRAGEGLTFIADESARAARVKTTTTDVTAAFSVKSIGENYFVSDRCRIAKGDGEFSEIRPIYGHFEDLLREDYKGELSVKQTFTLNDLVRAKFIMERARLKKITVNGKPITLTDGDFDVNFVEADITDLLVKGENEVVYTLDFYQREGVRFALFDPLATESLKNCLYYDTSIETTYLKGRFVVEKDLSISAEKCLPGVCCNLFEKGYPFFKGKIAYVGKIVKPRDGRATLELRGRFMTAKIRTDEGETDFVLDNRGDITDILTDGENRVEIILNSSLRNLFGPHHRKDAPDYAPVSPANFEFGGEWANGAIPKDYAEEYKCVGFGVDEILLINEK